MVVPDIDEGKEMHLCSWYPRSTNTGTTRESAKSVIAARDAVYIINDDFTDLYGQVWKVFVVLYPRPSINTKYESISGHKYEAKGRIHLSPVVFASASRTSRYMRPLVRLDEYRDKISAIDGRVEHGQCIPAMSCSLTF